MDCCDSMEECVFFQKNKEIPGFLSWEEIHRYCLAPGPDLCRRKIYLRRYGNPPSDELSPLGYAVSFR